MVGSLTPEHAVRSRTALEAVRDRLPKITLLAAVGSLAISTDVASPNHVSRIVESETPSPELVAESAAAKDRKCTTIRLDGLHIIMAGRTCADEGAKATTVDDGYPRFGWIYSAVYVDGVTKCGYILKDTLPEREPPTGAITACRSYRKPIRNFRFITRPNCGFINTVDSCEDGTYESPVSSKCSSGGIAYAQFASYVKSPWNVYGVKAPRFSRPLSDTQHQSVNYRAEFDVPGQRKTAQAVRTSDGWGALPPGCVKPKHTFGGNCKYNSRDEDQHGNKVCGNAKEVKKDAPKWRKLFHKQRKNK